METKKSKHADLEPKKSIFLQIGLIVALGLSLAAFEWESPVNQIASTEHWIPVEEDIIIKNTLFEIKKPTPTPITAPVIRIVENTSEDSPLLIDVEIDPSDEEPQYIPPFVGVLDDEKPVDTEEAFIVVEKMPEYTGGFQALQSFLAEHIEFPQTALSAGVQGTVYVYFVVEKDGSVTNIKILRGIGGGCDEEAERVIRLLPKWKPGEQRGKPVRVSFNMPVIFKLQ